MPSSNLKISLIAAACKNRGIGYKGDLPWRLRKEMAYFNRMTTHTKTSGQKNVVIMGRKTWFSIPEKYRPLPGRINIVMSETLEKLPEADFLVRSTSEAISVLASEPLNKEVDKIFVVGGENVYRSFLEIPECHRIYLTHVDKHFECDTFFPEFDTNKFVEVSDPDVPSEDQEENGIKYRFRVYERR